MSLALALKTATSDAHKIAESKPFQRETLSGTINLNILGQYFIQLHEIHCALETHFANQSSIGELIEWNKSFCHSSNLEEDIEKLKIQTTPTVFECTRALIKKIDQSIANEPLSLLGYFYVLEGSMNGNRFIVRAVRSKNSQTDCAFSYFDPYGEDQPANWARFKTNLEKISVDPSKEALIIESALEMFNGISMISDEVMQQSLVSLSDS